MKFEAFTLYCYWRFEKAKSHLPVNLAIKRRCCSGSVKCGCSGSVTAGSILPLTSGGKLAVMQLLKAPSIKILSISFVRG